MKHGCNDSDEQIAIRNGAVTRYTYNRYVIDAEKDANGMIYAAMVTKDGRWSSCNDFYSIEKTTKGTVIRGMSLDDEGVPRTRGRLIRENLGNMEILYEISLDVFNDGSIR